MGSSKMGLFVRGAHQAAKMPVFCNGKIVKQTADQPDEFETQIGQTLLDLEINSELKTQLRELSITGAKQIDVGDKNVLPSSYQFPCYVASSVCSSVLFVNWKRNSVVN